MIRSLVARQTSRSYPNVSIMTTQRLNFSFRSMSTALMGEYEKKIYDILHDKFQPKNLQVKDVSGGCGSMFAINVESEKFKGIPMIKQHRLVNEVLKDEISKWHGVQLQTKSA